MLDHGSTDELTTRIQEIPSSSPSISPDSVSSLPKSCPSTGQIGHSPSLGRHRLGSIRGRFVTGKLSAGISSSRTLHSRSGTPSRPLMVSVARETIAVPHNVFTEGDTQRVVVAQYLLHRNTTNAMGPASRVGQRSKLRYRPGVGSAAVRNGHHRGAAYPEGLINSESKTRCENAPSRRSANTRCR